MDMDTDDKGAVGPQEVTREEGVACDMEQSEGHLNAKVEDAPVFRPTKEEFKDPLAYISKIRPEAEAAGICRIVPPSGWKPPFTLNTSTLRFQTRKQNISRLGAAVRLSKDFDKRLRRFMFKRGTPLCGPVVVGGESVDPFKLYKAVTNKGGAHVVGDVAAWEALGREVGLPEGSGASFRDTYTTSLLPYEQAYFAGSKAADGDQVPPNARMTPVKRADPVSAASLVGRKFIRYIKEREVFMTATVGSATHRSSFHVKYATLPDQEGPVEPSEVISKDDLVVLLANGDDREAAKDVTLSDHCEKCYRTALAGEMACCYNCTALRHPKCMEPPQECLSGGDWFCPDCVIEADKPSKEEEEEELAKQNGKMGGRNGKMGPVPPPVERMLGAFGFEDGERYSLASFEKRAREWRNKYFESTLGTKEVEEEEVEAEFWRIVDNVRDAIDKRTPPTEDVMVEYGSDLDTGVYGSAFPLPPHLKTPNTTPSKQSNGGANANPKRAREEREYANSPWNINNLPVATGSMLHHLDVPVTGVVVPWLYVGMCMSAFCWHAEDHYLYSINYHHRGGPKQWYGIPGAQADHFESWMRGLYPDLFERNPDLLLQLVTMVNPSLVVKEGIPVYKTMQRPGEFIITFPQAYHAGFNHDFNVAEAVNFAPADFLPWGGKAQELYRRLNRAPVFSQDQMVVAAARALLAKPMPKENSACLPYVLQEMGRMVEQATRRADHARTLGIEHFEVSGEQEMAREQEQHMRQNRDRSTHPTAMGENADPNALPEWVYEELRPKTRSIASPDDSKRGPSSASKHSDSQLAPRHGLLKGPQCSVCKQYCFLEQVYCPTCGPELGVCGEHIEQCCACPVPTRVYKTRCPVETLHQLHQGLTTRQAELKAWQDEVDGIVATLELYKSPPKPEPNAARSAKAVASREVSEADHAITSVAPVAKALTRYLSPEMWSSKIDLHRGAQLLKTGAQLAVPPSTLRPLEEALRDARTQALAVAAQLGDDGGAILDARGGVGGSRRRALAKKKGEALERGGTGGEKDGRRSLNDVLTRAKCVLESPIKLETAAIAALKTVAEVTHLRREAWDLMGVRCSGEFDALDDLIAAAEAIFPQLEAECVEFREATTAPKGQGARIKGKIVSGRWEGRRYSFSASLEFRRRVAVIEKALQDRNISVPELDLLEKGLLEESESRSRKVKLDEEEWVDPDQLESLVPDAARRKPQKRKRMMPAFPPLSSFKKDKNGRMVPAYPPPPSYPHNGYYPYPYYPQYPPPGDYPAQEGHVQEYPPQEYGQEYPPQEYGQQGYAHPGYAQQGYYEYPEEPEA